MPAEWQLRAFRLDLAKLTQLVGSKDEELAAEVVATGTSAELDEDKRIRAPFATIVDEVIRGTLDAAHARGYRIALEAFADVTALRLTFDVNKDSKGYDMLTTYADRADLGPILTKIGMPSLALGWDASTAPWPWTADAPRVDWPSISYWSPAVLAASAQELAATRKHGALATQVRAATSDEFFADDNVDAVAVLAQLIDKARGKLAAKPRRSVTGPADGLLILCDGEQ